MFLYSISKYSVYGNIPESKNTSDIRKEHKSYKSLLLRRYYREE